MHASWSISLPPSINPSSPGLESAKRNFKQSILQELGESDKDLNSYLMASLLTAPERDFVQKNMDFLDKTLVHFTPDIATGVCTNARKDKEENKSFQSIIKNNELEKITIVTQERLDEANIFESKETLKSFLQ